MLLVRRFRGSVKGRVWYAGPLLTLLDVPGRKRLEQRLVRTVERAERAGLGLAEAFCEMDPRGSGEIRLERGRESCCVFTFSLCYFGSSLPVGVKDGQCTTDLHLVRDHSICRLK